MKRAEKVLNEVIMAEGIEPESPGNADRGEHGRQVVGNMGTLKKMDYTIMGAAVNLASRLEGVNKQYDSWILASDATVSETGSEIPVPAHGRVRVGGSTRQCNSGRSWTSGPMPRKARKKW
jgi:adenylate cyclase